MFEYHRPHRFVHIVRLRGHRIAHPFVWGGALIAIGVAWLLKGQGLIAAHDLWLLVPALVALSGVVRLVSQPDATGAVRAVVRLAVAAYLVVVIEHIGGWTLAATWPVLLIAVGVVHIANALFGRRTTQEPNW